MSSVNWGDLVKDAGSGGFEPIPNGDYEFKILDATFKMSGNNKPMFSIKCEVQTGAYAKRLVWSNLVAGTQDDPSANGYFFRKMDAIGLPKEFFNENTTNAAIEAALKGRTFKGKVGLGREYQGTQKNEIQQFMKSQAAGIPGLGAAPTQVFVPPVAAPVAPPAAPVAAAPVAPPVPAAPAPEQVAPAAAPEPAAPAPAAAPQNPWDSTPATPAVAPPPPTPF